MKKTLLSLFLTFVIVLSGCSGGGNSTESPSAAGNSDSSLESTVPENTPSTNADEITAETPNETILINPNATNKNSIAFILDMEDDEPEDNSFVVVYESEQINTDEIEWDGWDLTSGNNVYIDDYSRKEGTVSVVFDIDWFINETGIEQLENPNLAPKYENFSFQVKTLDRIISEDEGGKIEQESGNWFIATKPTSGSPNIYIGCRLQDGENPICAYSYLRTTELNEAEKTLELFQRVVHFYFVKDADMLSGISLEDESKDLGEYVFFNDIAAEAMGKWDIVLQDSTYITDFAEEDVSRFHIVNPENGMEVWVGLNTLYSATPESDNFDSYVGKLSFKGYNVHAWQAGLDGYCFDIWYFESGSSYNDEYDDVLMVLCKMPNNGDDISVYTAALGEMIY